jgi:class 3 adenylate cyclase
MSRAYDNIRNVRRVVVFFDICSSTTILEDLLRTENQRRWRDLLIRLKTFLVSESQKTPFDIYKFLGDGWVLLFDSNTITGPQLMRLLERLCDEYERLFHHGICEVLGDDSCQIGLTFGIDSGTLVKIVMNQRDEYIGRALNVAARLQSAIKQKDKTPAGKLLISKNSFASLGLAKTRKYAGKLVDRLLANVAGGEHYQVRKIVIRK